MVLSRSAPAQVAPPGSASTQAASGQAASVQALAPELGMRRVRWVQITITDDGVRAEVAGLAHRFPIVRPVTIQVANRLIRSGCPYVVRGSRGDVTSADPSES